MLIALWRYAQEGGDFINTVIAYGKKMMRIAKSNKGILFNVGAAAVVKALAALVQLALLPAYMHYFGNQAVLGAWLSMVGILSLIIQLDMGIGNGLRNRLTYALAVNDCEEAKKNVSSSYTMIGLFVALIGTSCVIITRFVDWNILLNIPTDTVPREMLTETATIMIVSIFVYFVLNLIFNVFNSAQMTALVSLIGLIQNTLMLFFLLAAPPSGNVVQSLRMLAWINLFCMNAPVMVATLIAFSTRFINIRPNLHYFSLPCVKSIFRLGFLIFMVQFFWLFTGHNEIFIARLFSPVDVVEYQSYLRVFGLAGIFFGLIMSPLWSATTKKMAQNQHMWIMKLYRCLLLIAAAASLLIFALIPMTEYIFTLWLNENAPSLQYNYAIIIAMVVTVNIWKQVVNTFAFAISKLKFSVITLGIAAILKIPLTYLMADVMTNWSAVALTYVIITVPNIVMVSIVIYKHLKENMM